MYNQAINKVLINLSSFAAYLLPLVLLTGPFLPDLFISIIALSFLFIVIKEKKFYYFNNLYFKFFFSLYVYLILSSLYSEYYLFSLKSSIPYIRFILFSLALWFLIENNKEFLKNFTIAFVITFIFAVFDGYFQYFIGHSIFGYYSAVPSRLNLSFDDKMILGGYLSRLLPLLIALIILHITESKKQLYLLVSLLLILSDLLIYLSGERTAIGVATISIIFIIIFLKKYRLIRILTLLVSISVIIIATVVSPVTKSRNIEHTIEQMGLNDSSERIILFSSEHEKLFISAYEIFLENKLLGSGPNTFRKHCELKYTNENCSTHPHNTYIQILSETGIIGLLFTIVIIIYFLRLLLFHMLSFFKNKFDSLQDTQVLLITCFFCTLWPFIPSLNFFNNWINIIYYLPVGFFLHSIYKR